MTTTVETYLLEGCGRCPLGGTPDCKVHPWKEALIELRKIPLACGLQEEVKWGVPCYTFQGKNVLLITALKHYCAMSFFKGVLLADPEQILVAPGKHSQSDRLVKFTSASEVMNLAPILKTYVFEAIEIEQAGLKVSFNRTPEPIPEELQQKFEEDPTLRTAFESLTPGRQRGYLLHFSQPKQAKTRFARIEKCTPNILNGIGLNDKYSRRKK
ncbi:MAG: YdeI/OmpD-associated family protein [Bacteroidota bacterium]